MKARPTGCAFAAPPPINGNHIVADTSADAAPVHATLGALVTVPRGVRHTYKNVSTTPGRMIVVATPAGLEHFFAALGQPDTGSAPPIPAGPPDFAAMAAIARQYGIEIVGPPPS